MFIYLPTQNKCDKLSNTDIAVDIGGPSLGHPGSELCVAKTWGEREGRLGPVGELAGPNWPANTEAKAAIAMETQTAGPASNLEMDPGDKERSVVRLQYHLPPTHPPAHRCRPPAWPPPPGPWGPWCPDISWDRRSWSGRYISSWRVVLQHSEHRRPPSRLWLLWKMWVPLTSQPATVVLLISQI